MEKVGYISHETLLKLQDPEWRAQRTEHAMLWTTNNPPSRAVIPVYIGYEPWWVRAWKRARCWVTLNHIDPGVTAIGQTHSKCKKCGKVWRVWS